MKLLLTILPALFVFTACSTKTDPAVDDLKERVEKLEEENRQLKQKKEPAVAPKPDKAAVQKKVPITTAPKNEPSDALKLKTPWYMQPTESIPEKPVFYNSSSNLVKDKCTEIRNQEEAAKNETMQNYLEAQTDLREQNLASRADLVSKLSHLSPAARQRILAEQDSLSKESLAAMENLKNIRMDAIESAYDKEYAKNGCSFY